MRLGLYNIRVLSATEPIPEGSSGILMESLLEGIAEYYSAELSEKVTSGMRKNILKGTANGSYRPYGYDIVEKKYVVNPYEIHLQVSVHTFDGVGVGGCVCGFVFINNASEVVIKVTAEGIYVHPSGIKLQLAYYGVDHLS